jgi:hypothetical protein
LFAKVNATTTRSGQLLTFRQLATRERDKIIEEAERSWKVTLETLSD